VPVNPGFFRRPKEGMALVAAAGPAMNFALALLALAVRTHVELHGRWDEVAYYAYLVNVVLGIFNLVPIPPLDGSRIVAVLMSNATYRQWASLDGYGMVLVLGLFFLFRDESSQALSGAYDAVTSVLERIVGA
jgi:Zn-dependent protease